MNKNTAIYEISATLGIDLDASSPEKVAKRAIEYCLEMADCYEEKTLEREAFEALAVAIQMVSGGV